MHMMTSGGPLSVDDSCKETTCRWMEGNQNRTAMFRYARPFDWHFCYQHVVDDHNNLHHAVPSIEDSSTSNCWEICVFAFILALTEVNAFLSLSYFTFAKGTIEGCPTLSVFSRTLAWQLLNNMWIQQEEANSQNVLGDVIVPTHLLLTAPNHARVYQNGQFICDAAARYQQHSCSHRCGKRIRTYCACSPARWVCTDCFANHIVRAENGN